jgi:hypothetical protein
MNISLPSGRRVHWLRAGFPACGGGRHGKKGAWQLDIGEITCRRCQMMAKANHGSKESPEDNQQ